MDALNNEHAGIIRERTKVIALIVSITLFNTCEICFTIVSIGEDIVILILVIIIMMIICTFICTSAIVQTLATHSRIFNFITIEYLLCELITLLAIAYQGLSRNSKDSLRRCHVLHPFFSY